MNGFVVPRYTSLTFKEGYVYEIYRVETNSFGSTIISFLDDYGYIFGINLRYNKNFDVYWQSSKQ